MYLSDPAILRVQLASILYGYKHISKINQSYRSTLLLNKEQW